MISFRIFASCFLAFGLTSCGALTGAAGSLIRAPMTLLKGMSGAVGRSAGIVGQADTTPEPSSTEAIAKRGAEIQSQGPHGISADAEDETSFASASRR